jgi:hypothetical protein
MMISKPEYLFFFCEGIGSVFDSQVLALLKAINEKNSFIKIFLFLGISDKKQKDEIQKRNIPEEIELIIVKLYPNYPFFNFMIRRDLRKFIKKTNLNLKNVIFHTRGEVMAWHLSKILAVENIKNVVPDIRGAGVEEIKEFSKLKFLKKVLKIYNYKSAFINLNKFNQLSAVSICLKEYLVKKYKIDPVNIHITPSLAGPNFFFDRLQRTKYRSQLNLSNDDILVVFSSGGTANWQKNDIIKILAEKGIKVLNLSKSKIEFKNVINKFVSYSEVPNYLNAADVAIIWRDKSIVNKVASPVKFSEYVCSGLPVIANESVDMIRDYIKKNSCGLIINCLDNIDINTLNQLKQIDRQAIAETGLSNFGIDKIIDRYSQIYEAMGN